MEYPLVVTTMSKINCHYVEYPDLYSALQASGISSDIYRDRVVGPLT